MKTITMIFLTALFAICIGLSGQATAAEAVNAPVVQKADNDTKAADTVKDETLKADSQAEKTKHEMHEMKHKAKHEMKAKEKHEMHEMKEKTKHEMHEMKDK